MTLEGVCMATGTAILILFADFFDCRRLRRENAELIAKLEQKEDHLIELHRQSLMEWWNGMEEAAQVAETHVPGGRSAAEIRKRIQERAIR